MRTPSAEWPAQGVLRVHPDPAALPRLGDEPGTNRFDDPRPRTIDRYLVRYAATTLRGCLLELLAWLRESSRPHAREEGVDDNDPDSVAAPEHSPWQALEDYLAPRQVARITATIVSLVSIDDPQLQHELDREPAVRALLDSDAARSALLDATAGSHALVHLDNGIIRLASALGRAVTQACSLALHDRPVPPDVIHYRSRHDDAADCWAIYDHTPAAVDPPEPLSPATAEHQEAVREVAALWELPLPPSWTGRRT